MNITMKTGVRYLLKYYGTITSETAFDVYTPNISSIRWTSLDTNSDYVTEIRISATAGGNVVVTLAWDSQIETTLVNNEFEFILNEDVTWSGLPKFDYNNFCISSMFLNLYQNTAENNKVDKTASLTSVGTICGVLREQCSVINPSLTIEYDDVPEFNYVYFPLFNRYYFVTNITSIKNGLWQIDLSVDVLMTYKDDITQQTAFIERSESTYDVDKVDDLVSYDYDKTISYIAGTDLLNLFDFSGEVRDNHNQIIGHSTDDASAFRYVMIVVRK